MLKLKMVALSL